MAGCSDFELSRLIFPGWCNRPIGGWTEVLPKAWDPP